MHLIQGWEQNGRPCHCKRLSQSHPGNNHSTHVDVDVKAKIPWIAQVAVRRQVSLGVNETLTCRTQAEGVGSREMILGRSKPRSATSVTHRQWVALVATLATLTWTSIVRISPELSLYRESRLASMAVSIPIKFLHSLVSNLQDPDKFIPLLSTYLPPGSAPLPMSTNTQPSSPHSYPNGSRRTDSASNGGSVNHPSGKLHRHDSFL